MWFEWSGMNCYLSWYLFYEMRNYCTPPVTLKYPSLFKHVFGVNRFCMSFYLIEWSNKSLESFAGVSISAWVIRIFPLDFHFSEPTITLFILARQFLHINRYSLSKFYHFRITLQLWLPTLTQGGSTVNFVDVAT